jgi:hypothetical protein
MRKPVPLPALLSTVHSFFDEPVPDGGDLGGQGQPGAPRPLLRGRPRRLASPAAAIC